MGRGRFGSFRLIAVAAAACAAATAGLPGSVAQAPAAVVSAPACATSGLVVWLDTRGNGAAGSIYYRLELTNLSGRACTLFGYPGVSAVNLAGRQLGSAAGRDPVHGPHLVTLARGATATVVLRIADVGNYPAATCRPVTAAGLRVYPPNQRASRLVPFPFRACSRPGPVYLSVEVAEKTA
jgi:Domain of unknown function (DUF4232)